MKVHYKCVECKQEWFQVVPGIDECLFCGHVYVEWVNYQEWKQAASPEYRRIIDGEKV